MGAAPGEDGLNGLFDASPDRGVRTSAAAELAFLAGLVAIFTAPFTAVRAVSVIAGVVALVFVLFGMAATSRANVAGRALVPAGLFLALASLVMVGMGYAGYDTAFGDGVVPTLAEWLDTLDSWLRLP
ncbi:hypothetical protein ASD66_13945 [Nocardioides sp. Root151]|nr:hypothetical protein ASD30_19790 [Nocardioides sp. Root140]KQZ70675.1 hypothetical protein ASD66_13945 [Nocardioides sp. Root151]KRF10986.1 hypothetical protein ASH02_19300 [Nocardioides sp. Soil796]